MALADITGSVGITIGNFINYALWVVILLLIYYGIKFFITPSSHERRAETGGGSGGRLDGVINRAREQAQTRRQGRQRRNALDPARGFIIRAEQAAEHLRDDELRTQDAAAVAAARRRAGEIRTNLRGSLRVIRAASHHLRGEGMQAQREFLRRLYEANQVILQVLQDEIHDHIPAHTVAAAQWNGAVRGIRAQANRITGLCGYLLDRIDNYISEGDTTINVPARTPGGRPGGSI